MIVYVSYNGKGRYWYYYHYDSNDHKTLTEGFRTHIIAEAHAKRNLGEDIEFKYNGKD